MEKQPTAPETNQPEQTEKYLFYNVMPKGKSENTIIQPKLTVVESAQTSSTPPTAGPNFFKKHLKLFVIIFIVIILAGGGYYAYSQYLAKPPKTDDLLGPKFKSHLNSETSNTASTTPSQISEEWQTKYFGSATCKDIAVCSDNSDPDRDGLNNLEEFKGGTDPNNADSDTEGLADGDELKVFLTKASDKHSGINPKYNDAESIKGGYDPHTDKKYTSDDIQAIMARIKDFGLHEPTIKTLGDSLSKIYHFDGSPVATTTQVSLQTATSSTVSTSSPVISGVDSSANAKQDRDAQRSNTFQTIGIALLKYQTANKTFPDLQTFSDMYAEVKAYNLVATNPVDPINKEPYVYSYTSINGGADFTMAFYSETQNQVIKVHAADAQKYVTDQQASTNDDQRKTDLDSIQSALLLYSNENIAGNQDYVFPTQAKLKTDLVPKYFSSLPKDPQTGKDYDYQVSATFNTFTLKTTLQAPPTGNTGYMCNQSECLYY